jgi:glycosyltransferase involved in cell wall biosynthesis
MTSDQAETSPLVSVLMLTRNHAPFLAQAINSVQAQSMANWELLIGDDHSTDGTGTIARQAAVNDQRIRVISSNAAPIGFHCNFSRLLAASRAPFVAFLEGDDWWCFASKLEQQLALLQADGSLAFCGGRTQVLDQRQPPQENRIEATGWRQEISPPPGCHRITFDQLIDGYCFHFSSVLMRRHAVELPDWIRQSYCLDRPLYLLGACHGDAGVLDQVVSIYRLHGGGIWAPLSPLQKARRSHALFLSFCRHFPHQHRRRFRLALSHIHWSYLAEALQQNRRMQTLAILIFAIYAAPELRLHRQPRITIGVVLRALLPTRIYQRCS